MNRPSSPSSLNSLPAAQDRGQDSKRCRGVDSSSGSSDRGGQLRSNKPRKLFSQPYRPHSRGGADDGDEYEPCCSKQDDKYLHHKDHCRGSIRQVPLRDIIHWFIRIMKSFTMAQIVRMAEPYCSGPTCRRILYDMPCAPISEGNPTRLHKDNCKEQPWEPTKKLEEKLRKRITDRSIRYPEKFPIEWDHKLLISMFEMLMQQPVADAARELGKTYPNITEDRMKNKQEYLRKLALPETVHRHIVQTCELPGRVENSTIRKRLTCLTPSSFNIKKFLNSCGCFILEDALLGYTHINDSCQYRI
ncbi:hypothetical protein BDV95DRAFT_182496 [Massariosphaeria phaeospora]|uniref:Uncharacterized protein n=1 Tax=Massariosphaeria phaeospora TaxID=100035 RepID=A0A7C8I3B8_9PLEO|nr:hypothetical protein BDV95DRAFT_182496 [Massariosphaeria phaeospora]